MRSPSSSLRTQCGTSVSFVTEFRGEYYVFPRDVSPSTYKMTFSYLKGLPLAFIHREMVEDLDLTGSPIRRGSSDTASSDVQRHITMLKAQPQPDSLGQLLPARNSPVGCGCPPDYRGTENQTRMSKPERSLNRLSL